MAAVPVSVTKPDGEDLPDGWVVQATKGDAPPIEASPIAASLQLTEDGEYTVEVSAAPGGFKKPAAQTITVASGAPSPVTVNMQLESAAPTTVEIKVIGPDDRRTVDMWTVTVTGEGLSTTSKSASDSSVELTTQGEYTFMLETVGPNHVLPRDEYTSKVVSVSGDDQLVAKLDGTTVDRNTPVTWNVSATQDTEATGPLVTVEAALMALIAVGFWTFVITLDPDDDGLGNWLVGVMAFIGLLIFGESVRRIRRNSDAGWSPVALAIGILMILAAFGLKGQISLTEEHQFAIATGGVAIAAFVIGLLRFDTVKAAASLPIVVLFIGLAAWPSGTTNMDPDVQQTLIVALGSILGISAIGEATQQATNNLANARVKAAEAAAAGATRLPSEAGARAQRPVTRPRGDMTRSDAS